MITLNKKQLSEAVEVAIHTYKNEHFINATDNEIVIIDTLFDKYLIADIVETIQHQSLRCGGEHE